MSICLPEDFLYTTCLSCQLHTLHAEKSLNNYKFVIAFSFRISVYLVNECHFFLLAFIMLNCDNLL
jgi:hypothetical protein